MSSTSANNSPGVPIDVPWSISQRLHPQDADKLIDQMGHDLLSFLSTPARRRPPTLQMIWTTGQAYHVPMIGVYCFYLRILDALWKLQAPPKPKPRPKPKPARPRPHPAAARPVFAPIGLEPVLSAEIIIDDRWLR